LSGQGTRTNGFTMVDLLVALGLATVILCTLAVAARVVYTCASLGSARCRTFSELSHAQLWAFDASYRIGENGPDEYTISGSAPDRCVVRQGCPSGEGVLLRGLEQGSAATVRSGDRAFLLFDFIWGGELQMRIRTAYGEDGSR